MALYHERHPSTGITHCSSSYFTHVPRQARDSTKSLPDVIVVRSNLLQIYKVRVPYDKSDAASLAESKLEQTASFPLAGLVDSMAVLRGRSSSQKDALLLTFRDAKLSVLDWDDNAHTIHTSSLHYFEGDPSLRMGRTVFPMGPKVVTDPQGRCAAVLMFHTQLALLPAMETEGLELDLMMDDPYGEGVEGPGRASTELVSATVGNSYVVNLAKMGIKKVRDVVFLHKYNEPVLLILHEVEPTWPARYRDAKDTMALAALSVNVVHKRHPRIWEASGLPSDTFRLVPVLTGGALALSQNMITYHTQGASSGLVVNSHALPGKVPEKLEIDVEGDVLPAQLAAEHAAKYPDNVHPESAPAMAATSDHSAAQLMLDLSAARHVWLSKSSVALLLKSGRLLLAHLTIEAGMVKQMRVEPSLNLGVASCGCQLGSNLVFLGSCLANSLLVHVTHLQESKKRGRDGDGFRDTAVSSKRARLEATDAPGPGTHVSTGDKEEEEQSKQALVTDRLLSFKVVDKLMGIGPMRDMAIGDPVSSAPGSHDRRGPHQLVACSGQGKHGALTVLRRSLVPELIVQVPQEVKGVWAVHHADAQTDTGMQLDVQGGPHHSFMLMSHPSSAETKVLETGDAMNQLTDAGAFVTDAPTICAGNILKHTLIVQVYPTGVKVVAGLEEVQDLPIQDILPSMEWRPQVVIAAACIADPYLLLHFSDGSAVLLSGDEEEGCLIGQDAANQALQADINADPTLRLTAATLYRDNSGWLHQVQSAHSAHLSPAQSEPEALAEGPAQMTPGAEGYDGVVEVEDAGLEGGQEGVTQGATGVQPAVKQEKTDDGSQHMQEEQQTQAASSSGQAPSTAVKDGLQAGNLKEQDEVGPSGEADAQTSTASEAIFGSESAKTEHDSRQQPTADRMSSEPPDASQELPGLAFTDNQTPQEEEEAGPSNQQVPNVQTYIVLCREQGIMQIFALPEMQLIFSYSNVVEGPLLLTQGGSSPTPLAAEQAQTHVTEARLESFGPTVVPDGTLLTYQAFHPPHQPLAFRRVPLDWTPHMTLTQEPPGPVPHPNAVQPTDRMQRFDNLGEGSAWSGIFILGAKPLWLLASRGKLVAHPMEVEGAVAGFSPFHNPSCPQGFVTTGMHDKACSLNICQMPAEVQLGTPWPLQRVAMQATPHRVSFYPEAGLYVVLLSKDGPHKEWLEAEEGGDMHAAYSYALAKESAKIKPKEAGYEVRLIRPGTWKGIWSYALGPAEDALCVKAMQLKNAKTGESEPVVAVGTCQSFGEDYPGTGRVLFFQITRKPAEGSEAEEQWATNMIYSREFRGPVTNLTSLEGYIILTIGNRLETHQWTGSNLLRTAFFDAPILISSLNVVKTYIIFGDVHKGIYFVNYRDQGKQLNLLSKDFDNSDISATEFVINGSQLHFLAADEGLNVRLFRYSNKTALSWKGQKLLPLGCLHTGHRVTRFLQQRVNSTDAINRHAAVFATQAGSLGYITPLLIESMEPLLQKLQRQMVVAQPQPAGLNPAAFRRRFQRSSKSLAGGQHFGKPLPAEGIIDGTSVFDYQHLTRSQQAVVAKACDSKPSAILNVLTQLANANAFF